MGEEGRSEVQKREGGQTQSARELSYRGLCIAVAGSHAGGGGGALYHMPGIVMLTPILRFIYSSVSEWICARSRPLL